MMMYDVVSAVTATIRTECTGVYRYGTHVPVVWHHDCGVLSSEQHPRYYVLLVD